MAFITAFWVEPASCSFLFCEFHSLIGILFLLASALFFASVAGVYRMKKWGLHTSWLGLAAFSVPMLAYDARASPILLAWAFYLYKKRDEFEDDAALPAKVMREPVYQGASVPLGLRFGLPLFFAVVTATNWLLGAMNWGLAGPNLDAPTLAAVSYKVAVLLEALLGMLAGLAVAFGTRHRRRWVLKVVLIWTIIKVLMVVAGLAVGDFIALKVFFEATNVLLATDTAKLLFMITVPFVYTSLFVLVTYYMYRHKGYFSSTKRTDGD